MTGHPLLLDLHLLLFLFLLLLLLLLDGWVIGQWSRVCRMVHIRCFVSPRTGIYLTPPVAHLLPSRSWFQSPPPLHPPHPPSSSLAFENLASQKCSHIHCSIYSHCKLDMKSPRCCCHLQWKENMKVHRVQSTRGWSEGKGRTNPHSSRCSEIFFYIFLFFSFFVVLERLPKKIINCHWLL